jgi:chromosome segregation ATPase
MIDVLLVLVCVLLAASTVAAIEYYRELRKAQKEYEKARDIVEDIVFSFNRELRREAETIESMAFKIDGTTIKADAGLRKIESLEKRVAPVESQLSVQLNTFDAVSESNALTIEKITTVDTKLETVDTKIRDIESSQESIKTKITVLEEHMQKFSIVPEMKTELIMPGIPIKRDKAMAALTDTEIAVLEFLSAEGPKTAPEIKEKVKLSREHTARLMKKLYEEGYLERETGKLPFKYSIKKEMEKLLRKPEPPAT